MNARLAITIADGEECHLADNPINGNAGLPTYPWALLPASGDVSQLTTCDGIVATGGTFCADRLSIDQVAGAGLVVNGNARIDGIRIHRAVIGAVLNTPDSFVRGVAMDGFVKDGLILSGSGLQVDMTHICGADRACVITQACRVENAYHEAARIGTDILPGADGTQIDGLNIGPGSCWERGLRIGANGCTINGLTGAVQGQDQAVPSHRDIAGVEILPGILHTTIDGQLVVTGDGSAAAILRGTGNTITLKGGWNGKVNATFLRVVGPVKDCTAIITDCSGDGGTVFDFSAMIDLGNNHFSGTWDGSAARAIMPPKGFAPTSELVFNGARVNAH
jgi:hypothetical protein